MATGSGEKQGHICPHQIAFFFNNPFRKIYQNPKKMLREYVRQGDTVIDIGCGPGFFSLAMAEMVGKGGRVYAVDVQEEMLRHLRRKSQQEGLNGNLKIHRCRPEAIGLTEKADFILACYIVHEVPDCKAFINEVKSLLKDNGKLLIVEPAMHVTKTEFERMLLVIKQAGLKALDFPKGKGGKSVLCSL